MNVSEFVSKWQKVELTERSASQQHFLDPTWLDLAHRKLDEAVFAAYGWEPSLSDDEILAHLLALNQERASTTPAET
jgi:hypothetical protein